MNDTKNTNICTFPEWKKVNNIQDTVYMTYYHEEIFMWSKKRRLLFSVKSNDLLNNLTHREWLKLRIKDIDFPGEQLPSYLLGEIL